jgi:hypothetical protein
VLVRVGVFVGVFVGVGVLVDTARLVKITTVCPLERTVTTAVLPLTDTSRLAPGSGTSCAITLSSTKPVCVASVTLTLPAGTLIGAVQLRLVKLLDPAGTEKVPETPATVNENDVPGVTPVPATLQISNCPGTLGVLVGVLVGVFVGVGVLVRVGVLVGVLVGVFVGVFVGVGVLVITTGVLVGVGVLITFVNVTTISALPVVKVTVPPDRLDEVTVAPLTLMLNTAPPAGMVSVTVTLLPVGKIPSSTQNPP